MLTYTPACTDEDSHMFYYWPVTWGQMRQREMNSFPMEIKEKIRFEWSLKLGQTLWEKGRRHHVGLEFALFLWVVWLRSRYLLRWNVHNIKLTILKLTGQWDSVHSQHWAALTSVPECSATSVVSNSVPYNSHHLGSPWPPPLPSSKHGQHPKRKPHIL